MSGLSRHPDTSVYRHRKVVPEVVRSTLGRREIIKSLDTKDRNLAKVRNHRVGAFVAEVILVAKEQPHNEALKVLLDEFADTAFDDWDATAFGRKLKCATARDEFDDDPIERYSEKWFHWLVTSDRVEVEYIDGEPGVLLGPVSDRRAETLFEEYVEITGLNATFGHEASAMKQFRSACLQVLDDHAPRSKQNNWRPHVAAGSIVRNGRPGSVTLSKGMSLYKEAVGVRHSTGMDWDTAIGRLIAFMGEDCDIGRVTPDTVFDFRDRLLAYPSRLRKKHRDLTFDQLCELGANQPDIETLRPQTVNKNLAGISAMFEWLKRNRYMTLNPADGVKAEGKKNFNRSRLPFDADDIGMIFGPGYPARSANADYWLPILAYFTGCREEELAQLTVGAVKNHDGVAYFDIQGNVKNPSSVRPVPVHSRLVGLGFLDHVQARGQPDRLLFDRLALNKKGRLSDQFQKRFHRSLRDRGITDSRKVFHSFRHLFVDFMRDSSIPIQVQNALTGHSGGGSNRSYGDGFSIPHLASQMNSIRFWELPLETLK